jgi:hypothetical protein
MSEVPDCPYCGAAVHTDRVMDYDSKIKLRCNNCGGFFEFMPGFGAFTLPDEERRGPVRHEGSVRRTSFDIYQAEAPWESAERPPPAGNCGTACFVIICFCCFLPILLFILMIAFGIGLFWF